MGHKDKMFQGGRVSDPEEINYSQLSQMQRVSFAETTTPGSLYEKIHDKPQPLTILLLSVASLATEGSPPT